MQENDTIKRIILRPYKMKKNYSGHPSQIEKAEPPLTRQFGLLFCITESRIPLLSTLNPFAALCQQKLILKNRWDYIAKQDGKQEGVERRVERVMEGHQKPSACNVQMSLSSDQDQQSKIIDCCYAP